MSKPARTTSATVSVALGGDPNSTAADCQSPRPRPLGSVGARGSAAPRAFAGRPRVIRRPDRRPSGGSWRILTPAPWKRFSCKCRNKSAAPRRLKNSSCWTAKSRDDRCRVRLPPIDAGHRDVPTFEQQSVPALAQSAKETPAQNHHGLFRRDERRMSSGEHQYSTAVLAVDDVVEPFAQNLHA